MINSSNGKYGVTNTSSQNMNNQKDVTNQNTSEAPWFRFLQSALFYATNRIKDEPTSEIISRGLEVFHCFPESISVSLFILDEETFEFHHSNSLPIQHKKNDEANFQHILEEGGVAAALDAGKAVFWDFRESNSISGHFLIIPLIASQGVMGLVLLSFREEHIELQHLLIGLCTLHANQFAALLNNAKMLREMKNLQSILEQKIALRTQSIKQSKRELQIILDSIQSGIFIIDKETGCITDTNHITEETIGLSKDELTGMERIRLNPEDSDFDAEKPMQESLESRLVLSNGTIIPILHRTTTITLGDQEYVLESFIDISERIKVEEALKDSEMRFRTMFAKAGIGMLLLDLDGNILETNHAFCAMIGYSDPELKKLTNMEITHPGDIDDEEIERQEQRSEKDKDNFQLEKRYIHKDGSIIWGRLTSTLISDTSDKPLYVLDMVEDITEKKKHQETLYHQTNLLNGVADATNYLLTVDDFDQAIKYALKALGNSAEVDIVHIYENLNSVSESVLDFKQQFIFTADQNIAADYEYAYSENFSFWYEQFESGAFVTGIKESFPEQICRNLEKLQILSTLIVPIHIHEEFWGVIAFDDCKKKRSWTEAEISILQAMATSIGGAIQRERTQKELIISKQKAEEASKLKSSLLANMSHEIRTPINGIFGFAQMLSDEVVDMEHQQMSAYIVESSQRLMTTLDAILKLSEFESKNLKPSIKEVNLGFSAIHIARSFDSMIQAKGLTLHIDSTEDDLIGYVDETLFHQVVFNIVDNAVKYTEKGNIKIKVNSRERDGKIYGIIKVIDTGIGIPEEKQEVIFQEFRQVSEGYSRKYEGTGLGLALAKRMVELMQGEITVESEIGKGSTFSVIFPVVRLSHLMEQNITSVSEFHNDDQDKSFQHKKLLLVEDNYINQQVVKVYLRKTCSVDFVEEGLSAISMAGENKYDAILMDINLGEGMDGIETAENIRQLRGYENVPIIAVTGYAMSGDRERLLDRGFDEYLAKPFSKRQLLEIISKFFNTHDED